MIRITSFKLDTCVSIGVWYYLVDVLATLVVIGHHTLCLVLRLTSICICV